jgi:histidinol-phosphate aminotransferase
MPVSRRTFLASVGAGGAGVLASPLIHARGREAAFGAPPQGVEERKADRRMASRPGVIRIDSNENPVGPGERAIAAVQGAFNQANRYPVLLEDDLKDAIAKIHGATADQVILGCGSGELLRSAVQAFTARDRAYVAPAPTFETPGQFAAFIGTPVNAVPVDAALSADLDAMAKAARGAGLVYLCNPNNPTATVHSRRTSSTSKHPATAP